MLSPRLFRSLYFICFVASAALAAEQPHSGTHCAWRATNTPSPLYLIGSIHGLSSKDYPLPTCFDNAVFNSQVVFFELAPDPRKNYEEYFRKAAEYPKGQTLNGKVHKETYEFLAKACRRSSIRFDEMAKYKPWFIGMYIWGVRGYSDVSSEYGVDAYLARKARLWGKKVEGLVSVEDHIDVMGGLSDIDSEIVLLNALVRGDKRRDDYNEGRALWKKGDLAGLYAFDRKTGKSTAVFNRRLLDERNMKWIPKIESAIKSKTPTTVVAGALHFVGPNNVLSLLQKRGYRFEQM